MTYKDYEPRESELRMIAVIERQQAENERLRAALQRIIDAVPECDIHFQGVVARDIAWAAIHPENVVKVVVEQQTADDPRMLEERGWPKDRC